MHHIQRQQTHEYLRKQGIQHAVFANPHSVTWLTGFAPPVQVGTNLFSGGPALVWYEDGAFTLITLDGQASIAKNFEKDGDGTIETYLGYTIEEPIKGANQFVSTFENVLARSKNISGKLGVELDHITGRQLGVLQSKFSSAEIVAIDDWLVPLRMVKTEEELKKLRANFRLTDIGHMVARSAVTEGKSEIDVWMEIHSAINQAAGCRVPLGNDCVVGHREANIGGWPLDHKIRQHDSLIVDLSTILHGYWSDSCATYYADEPTAQQVKMHRTASDALEFAISLIQPGVVAKDVDQKVRQFIADAGYAVYPHHTGHGVGVSGHEEPRIVPYNDTVLEAGMVIMLEPGIYMPSETSVRLEDAVLITDDGAEVLTAHDKSLP
jgi:Xaa-Pro aminopeptidase